MNGNQTDDKTDRVFPQRLDRNEVCSKELYRYLFRQDQIFDLFFFSLNMATAIDKQRLVAAKALAVNGSEEDQLRLETLNESPQQMFDKLTTFSNLQSENLCIRSIDNFTSYLSEIVQRVMKKKPEILKSSESILLEDVLEFKNYKDLIEFISNRKINELSYKKLTDFEKFLKDRTGLFLTNDNNDRKTLMLGIEARNIYTHNRGIVNEVTLRKLSEMQIEHNLVHGERHHLGFDELAQLHNASMRIARGIDQRFAEKFKIGRKKYATFAVK